MSPVADHSTAETATKPDPLNMKAGLLILAFIWAAPIFAFSVEIRSPEEIARDNAKALARKEKLSRKLNQQQVTEALRQAVQEIGIVDGIDLTKSNIESDWDWGLDLPYAWPSCGEWQVETTYGRWGRPKSLEFTLSYKKKIDGKPDGRSYFVFIKFDLKKKKGKFVAEFSDFGKDEWILLA